MKYDEVEKLFAYIKANPRKASVLLLAALVIFVLVTFASKLIEEKVKQIAGPTQAPAAPPSVPASVAGASSSGPSQTPLLRVSRLVADTALSHYEQLSSELIGRTQRPKNEPPEYVPVDVPIEDAWVPSKKWFEAQACHEKKRPLPVRRKKCGTESLLLPTFDVVVEHVGGPSATIRSIRMLLTDARFPQGDASGGLALPASTIPRSAQYELHINDEYMSSSESNPVVSNLDIIPPLIVQPGVPTRFSLAMKYRQPESATTLLAKIEITTTQGAQFLSPPFSVHLP